MQCKSDRSGREQPARHRRKLGCPTHLGTGVLPEGAWNKATPLGETTRMRLHNPLTRPLVAAVVMISMAVLWNFLAPTQFGGRASYVIIAGASMEPSLQSGDLVIARQANAYTIGDVVTYTHPYVGPVIHRIIDTEGPTFVLQGDNNDWIDSYQPAQDEILGKAWITIPMAASILQSLRSPPGLSLLSIAVGFIVLATLTTGDKGEEHQAAIMKRIAGLPQSLSKLHNTDGWLFVLGTVLLGSILLGAVAFANPRFEMVQIDIPYQHEGKFSYHATGGSEVYDYGRVETGDPVFLALVKEITLDFNYKLSSTAEVTSAGEYKLSLELSEPNGWHRRLELVPPTSFSGTSFSTSTTIDLNAILALVRSLEEKTGYSRPHYDVHIIPSININASLAGHPIAERFSPPLIFKLDMHQLYLDGSSPLEEGADPVHPVELKMQPEFQPIPATVTILGIELMVDAARWIASLAFILSALGIIAIFYPITQAWRRGESTRISVRYPELILGVDKHPNINKGQVVEVSSFDDLARLAESKNMLILHHQAKTIHTYWLQIEDVVYRYKLEEAQQERAV